jgi:tRNA(Ile)-lysidine synthase
MELIDLSVSHNKFDELFHSSKKIALAVSGGPDSLAMMHMLYSWSKQSHKELVILTVNHNLRDEAKLECDYVKSFALELGLNHILLEWVHDGIASNVHDKARTARYDLMTNWCKSNNVETLCTAHHMDDRVENFFIRVSKGAGILGLIDKQKITYNDIEIIRPFFDYKKADLISYLDNNQIKYFEDRSNDDPKYLRTNIRRWLELLPEEIDRDLFKQRVISVKTNLERASKVIERIFQAELGSKAKIHEKYASLSALPEDREIAYMVLSHLITIIGKSENPRLESIERLYENLVSGNVVKSTLGQCIIEYKGKDILFTKEVGRNTKPQN